MQCRLNQLVSQANSCLYAFDWANYSENACPLCIIVIVYASEFIISYNSIQDSDQVSKLK